MESHCSFVFSWLVLSILFPKNANRLINLTSTSIRLAKLETQSNFSIQYGNHLQTELKMILMLRVFQFKKFNFRQIFKIKFQKCLPPSPYLHAEIVETTFVRSRFSNIRHGYDFVPSHIQKKRPETTRNDGRLVSYLPGTTRNKIITG